MGRMLLVEFAVLVQLKLLLQILAVLGGRIILALANRALHGDEFGCCFLGSHTISP